MPEPLSDEALRRRARKRVDIKIGFYIHALVYVCVNLGLFAWNLYTGGHRWHVLPLLGWGLGLAIHGLVAFLSLRGDGLHQRMLDSEIRRLEKRR
jgi:hypothetical protein